MLLRFFLKNFLRGAITLILCVLYLNGIQVGFYDLLSLAAIAGVIAFFYEILIALFWEYGWPALLSKSLKVWDNISRYR